MITAATPDAGHNWLNDKAYGALRGEFHVSDLGAWPIAGAQRGGHRGGARACGAAGFRESGGRLARGTGMMAGSDGSLSLADRPVMFPCLGAPRLTASNVRDGGIYIDGTFGAGGYTREILAARRHAGHRASTAIRTRWRLGADLVARGGRPADRGRGAFLRARQGRTAVRPRRRSTASCSISACRRCSSTRPSAASRSGSTGRSTCGWAARGRARPTWLRARPSAISPTSSSSLARSGIPARSPAPSSPRARKRRSQHQGAGGYRRARGAARPGADPSRDADVSGAADVRQRELNELADGAGCRRARF